MPSPVGFEFRAVVEVSAAQMVFFRWPVAALVTRPEVSRSVSADGDVTRVVGSGKSRFDSTFSFPKSMSFT